MFSVFACHFVPDTFSRLQLTKHTAMAKNYLKGWFIIDICSSVPAETATVITEAIISAKGGNNDDGGLAALTNLKIIRILRLTKLLRLAKMGQILETLEFNFPSLAMIIGLFRLGFTMMLVSHINACLFYWIGTLNIGNSWISKYMFGCCDTSVTLFDAQDYGGNGTECFDPALLPLQDTLYVDAVYWSLTTLATVGYGEITPCNEMEQLYTAAAMVIGSAMFAYIVGSISTIAMESNGQEMKMRSKILQLQEYLELRKIPKELAEPIRRQCINKWKNTVFDEEGLLLEFNPKIKRKIMDLIVGDFRFKIPLVHSSPNEDFKTDLLSKLKVCNVDPDTCIVDFNDLTYEMYIMKDGMGDLFLNNAEEEATFIGSIGTLKNPSPDASTRSNDKNSMGIIVNELGMLAKEPCREKVVATTYVSLYSLRRSCFDEVLRMFNEAAMKPYIEDRIVKERFRLQLLLADKVGMPVDLIEMKVGICSPSTQDALNAVSVSLPGKSSGALLSPNNGGGGGGGAVGSPPSSPVSKLNSLNSPFLVAHTVSARRSGNLSMSSPFSDLREALEQVQQQQEWCQQSMRLIMESGGLRPVDVEVSLSGIYIYILTDLYAYIYDVKHEILKISSIMILYRIVVH